MTTIATTSPLRRRAALGLQREVHVLRTARRRPWRCRRDVEREIAVRDADVEAGHADGRERRERARLDAFEFGAAAHHDRFDRGVGQHVLRDLERELRRAFDVRHLRAVERVVANHRDVDVGLRERRSDQRGCGVADLVSFLVELERRLREIFVAPIGGAAAVGEDLNVRRRRRAGHAAEIRAHAIRARIRRREIHAHGIAARGRVGLATVSYLIDSWA